MLFFCVTALPCLCLSFTCFRPPGGLLGERPYSCKDCDKQFTQLNALQRHQRIHTGEKPYMCGLCRRTFTDKSTLRRHTMVSSAYLTVVAISEKEHAFVKYLPRYVYHFRSYV